MRQPLSSLTAALLVLVSASLSGCSGGDTAEFERTVGELRAELQRTQKDNEKLAAQVATQTRRIDGLTADIGTVRQLAMEGKPASADAPAAVASVDGVIPGASGGFASVQPAALSTPEIVAIKTYLGTDEGRKLVTDAIDAEREAREIDRAKRVAESMVDRFAKTAALTEDQVKRMKEIMDRAVIARRTLGSLRDLGPDATIEQRDAFRTENNAKTEELRKQTDSEVRALLDSKQYESYQTQQEKLRTVTRGGNGNRQRGAGQNGQGGGDGNN